MSAIKKRLILFTRFPVPGKVKTRLIPLLGAEGAAALHRRLVLRALRTARIACQLVQADLEVRYDGGSEPSMSHWLGDGARFLPQETGDLGERMAQCFVDGFRDGSPATVVIGSDCPSLTPEILTTAFANLSNSSVILGPARDGGYYLLGLTRLVPELFRGIPWGTDRVLSDSMRILSRLHIEPALLPPLDDLDRPTDLVGWKQIIDLESFRKEDVSVVIPALNEAGPIVATIQSIQQCPCLEIIVVDGGSTDSTAEAARGAGAIVLTSSRGRARQMNAGAAQAVGGTLLFLHSDTLLGPGWLGAISRTVNQPNVAVGAFRLRISGNFRGKSFVEWATRLRSRWLRRPYGDQGLFLTRALFEETGGFAELPIMEDYELIERLSRRGRVVTVTEEAITSGRRWQSLGVFRTTLKNQLMLAGYHLGVEPRKLAEFYRGSPPNIAKGAKPKSYIRSKKT